MMTTPQYQYEYRRPHIFAWIVVGLLALLVVGALISPIIYPRLATPAYPGFPGVYPYFFFPFGLIFLFILVFIVVRFAFWGWGWRRNGWYGGYGMGGDPEQILRRRYARGEITKEQFDQMLRDLRASSQQQTSAR
jgi:putative membrane protein